MANEFTHDRKALGFDERLDGRTNIANMIVRPRRGNASRESALRDVQQLRCKRIDLADRDSDRRVGVHAF